jgi:hypothetical protein
MNDDYLFDGAGVPDPDVERLERLLGPLRSNASVPPITVRLKPDTTGDVDRRKGSAHLQVDRRMYLGLRFLAPALAAAAAVVLMVGVTWKPAAPPPATAAATSGKGSWEVSVLVGTPRVGANALVGEGRIAVGQTLTTDAGSRAAMEVSDIGHVTVDEGTQVRLVESRDGHHRLALDRGTLHASIAAPPGQFVVSTPTATATDLGCIYSLHVDEDGSGLLTVEVGWVAFEERGRESFVPAGASSRTDRVSGPGTPRYDDAEAAFRDAVDEVDSGRDAGRKAASLRYVLDRARGRDAMTLWHLISRVGPADRAAVVDALNVRVPLPSTVSRDAVLRLDRAALDQWWNALGLNEAAWWRMWKVNAVAPAVGIKETARLTIYLSRSTQPVSVTDRNVLDLSNVYAGTFIGAQAEEPDRNWPRYTITFDIQTHEGVKVGGYAVEYTRDISTSDGFVYLPGPGDAWYRSNISTILRTGQDGNWFHSSKAWSAAINARLP